MKKMDLTIAYSLMIKNSQKNKAVEIPQLNKEYLQKIKIKHYSQCYT